jgi:hypothetical protein
MQIKIDDLRMIGFIVPDKIINNIHTIINNNTHEMDILYKLQTYTPHVQMNVEINTSMEVYAKTSIVKYLLPWQL